MAKNTKKVSVSIVILTLNALDLTKEELVNISRLKIGSLDSTCIVVDNGSSDETMNELKKFSLPNMKYKFVRSEKNLGFCGGNNLGIIEAIRSKSDYVIIMNNDIVVPNDLLQKLVSYMQKYPEVGIVSPKMYFAKGYEFHKNRYKKSDLGKVIWYAGGVIDWDNIYTSHRGVDEVDKGQFEKTLETDSANGACMIIRTSVFKECGLLDESLFLYWEDADFSIRVKNSGKKVVYYPKTYLWHKVSSTAGGSGSSLNDYFLTRNRYFFALRYAKLRTKIAVVKDTFKLAILGRTWEKKGAVDAIVGRKGKGSWK